MTPQQLADVLMQRATVRAMSEPDPFAYWVNFVDELKWMHPAMRHNNAALLLEQLTDFGIRLGLLKNSPLEVN